MMGNNSPTTFESAPSYDDLFADHPVNQQPPSGSSTAYARVPQQTAQEHPQDHHASPNEADLEANVPSETPLHALGGSSRPHVHCEACDKIGLRREKNDREKHCCTMVTLTFITFFLCMMLLGIVIASKKFHH